MFKQLLAVRNFPSLLGKEDFSFSTKLVNVLKIYGILLLVLIFVYAPAHHLVDYLVQNVLHYKSLNLQYKADMDKVIKRLGYIPAVIYICLIGPIIEETVFRLPLSFKKNHVALGLAFAVLLFSGLLPVSKSLNIYFGIWPAFAIRAGISLVFYFIIRMLLPNDIRLKENLKFLIIILSIWIFGLMHIGNYTPIQWPIIWIYPIYVLPQLLIGWAQTFVRFKYGFVWGIMLHCLVNSVSTGLYYGYTNKTTSHSIKPIPIKTRTKIADTSQKK